LLSGATYNYMVIAVDAAGNQSDGATASATTSDTVAPTVPTNVSAVPASGPRIDLNWTASTDAAGVSGYSIERCSGAGCADFAVLSSSGTPGYSAVGLASATSYSFRIRAYDPSSNYSGYSQVVSAVSYDVTAPTGPSTISAVAAPSGTQIDLSWPAATDNVGVSGYLVERCTGAGCSDFIQIVNTASTSYSTTGLAYSTPYSFRVRAYDAFPNYGAYTATTSATTANAQPPTTITALSATATSTSQINLSWPAASSSIGVSGYQIDRCSGASCGNFAILTTTTSTTYSAVGLSPGTPYSFRVRAYDVYPNYGGYSPTASATTQGSSGPPNETISYQYDALGRLISTSRAGTVNNGEQAQYQYDANGNRTNVTVNAAP
jgi:YD repeat-containing protein